jgi:hypothetical protein
MIVHNVELVYRRGRDIWVACLGEDYFVHFISGTKWRAFRPRALEPIVVASSLNECVLLTVKHYERRRQESARKIQMILSDPVVQRSLTC